MINNDITDIAKVGTVAGGSWGWFASGLPWGEITLIGGAVYILLKIILILPDLKEKYFKRKDEDN